MIASPLRTASVNWIWALVSSDVTDWT